MSDDPICDVCNQSVTVDDPGRIVDTLSAPAVTLGMSFTPTVRKDTYRHDRCA